MKQAPLQKAERCVKVVLCLFVSVTLAYLVIRVMHLGTMVSWSSLCDKVRDALIEKTAKMLF